MRYNAIEMKYTRSPEHDRRIKRGDDFAGDAWLNNETGQIEYQVNNR